MYYTDEWEMVEHYAWYDGPLTYLMKHLPTGNLYLCNATHQDVEKGEYEDLWVRITPNTLKLLKDEKMTVREALSLEVETDSFFVMERTEVEPRYVFRPCTRETLQKEILYDDKLYNFTI